MTEQPAAPAKSATADSQTQTATSTQTAGGSQNGDPPVWLADMMADSHSGGEAREFWNGVLQARHDAAAYREIFTQPAEARLAAERARVLEEIDRAYFNGDATDRSKLAATMLREDPAAFREMVIEGLRALEEAEKHGPGLGPRTTDSRLARVFGGVAAGAHAATTPRSAATNDGSTGVAGHHGSVAHERRMAEYVSFEKSANEDLERSVGVAIGRTLEQALPNTGRGDNSALKSRLAGAIRQDVEKALQGDRQLGEQVAQLLSGKTLNQQTRAQVVRLIGERAEQLVPGATKRILSDWTQTTIAAHREKSGRGSSASSHSDLATVSTNGGAAQENAGNRDSRGAARGSNTRSVDYRKLSDEQILAM